MSVVRRIAISQPSLGQAERDAVLEVLDSGMLVQGQRVAELERRFSDLVGTAHAVATSSGTTALHLALLAHGVGPGDEVITSPFSFIASTNAILYVGATPVFVDVREEDFNLDPERLESAVTPRTRAVIPVHLYGQMCDLGPIEEVCRRRGLVLIEDAAQAVGATYLGRTAGSFGTGCFSLYATKNVMTAEGGMVTTDDPEIAERIRMLRSHGMRQRYRYEMLGYNFRMTDVHAAIGLPQMDRVEATTEARRRNAAALSGLIESVITPRELPGRRHVWHQYTVRLDGDRDRDAAVARLTEAGIGTGIFYPTTANREPHIRAVVGELEMPVAERLAREVFSLPVHPGVGPEDVERIAEEVNRL